MCRNRARKACWAQGRVFRGRASQRQRNVIENARRADAWTLAKKLRLSPVFHIFHKLHDLSAALFKYREQAKNRKAQDNAGGPPDPRLLAIHCRMPDLREHNQKEKGYPCKEIAADAEED